MSALALPGAVYDPPALVSEGEAPVEQPWLIWAIFVYTFTAALAWASYCVAVGGSPDIDVGWFRIKVACYR